LPCIRGGESGCGNAVHGPARKQGRTPEAARAEKKTEAMRAEEKKGEIERTDKSCTPQNMNFMYLGAVLCFGRSTVDGSGECLAKKIRRGFISRAAGSFF